MPANHVKDYIPRQKSMKPPDVPERPMDSSVRHDSTMFENVFDRLRKEYPKDRQMNKDETSSNISGMVVSTEPEDPPIISRVIHVKDISEVLKDAGQDNIDDGSNVFGIEVYVEDDKKSIKEKPQTIDKNSMHYILSECDLEGFEPNFNKHKVHKRHFPLLVRKEQKELLEELLPDKLDRKLFLLHIKSVYLDDIGKLKKREAIFLYT